MYVAALHGRLSPLREPVDEEVEEQLEAPVGIVDGELIGEPHEMREAVGRERGHVVPGHRSGLAGRR
jgi:hypothetical protein